MKNIALNVFELAAKIELDDTDYKKKLDDSEGKFSKFAGTMKKGFVAVAKIGAATVGAAASAVAALTKESIESYAEYEQLVGGAELMFGKAYDKVAENAKNAYKTVQMSQNEYLQQVNGFATGLKSSLKGNEQAAADLAHKIIQAEADVVAATGNSQEAVQNAFNGIMKSNFTMLDNLQIGITPTKEGFQEVINKVNEWNKTNGNATKYQMGNLADMQAALVDYVDMVGMKGYAEREASQTIQGSLASTKAAYTNLITGLSNDNANIEELVNNLVTSLVGDGTKTNPGLVGNVLPRIKTALGGIGTLVSELAPIISAEIPPLISTLLPYVIEGAMGIISSLSTALPEMVTIVNSVLGEQAVPLVMSLVNGILGMLPQILETAGTLILTLAQGIGDALPELLPAIAKVGVEITNKLASAENLELILGAALQLVLGLARGLADAIPYLNAATTDLTEGINKFLTNPENLALIISAALEIILALGGGLLSAIPELLKSVEIVILDIIANFKDADWAGMGTNLVEGFKNGIASAWGNLKEWFTGLFGDLISIAKEILGIASPSKVFKEFGKFIDEGLAIGVEENKDVATGAVDDLSNSVVGSLESGEQKILYEFNKMSEEVLEKVEKLAKGIKDKMDEISSYFDAASEVAELEYELWQMGEGANASEIEKTAKKIELLNQQLLDQEQVVLATNEAYQEMAKLYGENSAQAMEYKKLLLEEQLEYQKLNEQLTETQNTYEGLAVSQMSWASKTIGTFRSVAAAITGSTKTVESSTAKTQEKNSSAIGDAIGELIDIFTSGRAKMDVNNTRDLRRALNNG